MSPLVFVHGWGVKPSVFDGIREACDGQFETVAPALPGRAMTRGAARTLESLAGVLSSEAPARCTVVAWSMGALVAIAWARARPDQVERLVLIAATPCFVRRDGWESAMPSHVFDDFAGALSRDCQQTLARFAALQALGGTAARAVTQTLRESLAPCAPANMPTLEEDLTLLRETDLRPTLADVRQDVLLIHGVGDQVVPHGAAHYLASHLHSARLERIEDAAHAPFISHEAHVARLLKEHAHAR